VNRVKGIFPPFIAKISNKIIVRKMVLYEYQDMKRTNTLAISATRGFDKDATSNNIKD